MNLKEIVHRIDVWEDWRDNYKYYVPKFITQAVTKDNWTDWDKDVFNEFFEKSANQCVSSLQQGYFSNAEKDKIKQDWYNIAPMLKAIAQSQEIPLFDTYKQLRSEIFKHTDNNKDAAVNRMLAGLQPKLLCTIVRSKHLNELCNLLKSKCNTDLKDYQFNDWCKDSNRIYNIFKKVLPELDDYERVTYPWVTLKFLQDTNINELTMQVEKEKVIQLLKYKKQIILQGPPGTGKTKFAKEVAAELIPLTDAILAKLIIKDMQVKTAKGQVSYTVEEVDVQNKQVTLLREKNTRNTITFSSIINSYKEKKWLNEIDNNDDRMAVALAKYVYDHMPEDSGQFKLIQFHPSYSYEDFVRGIVAKPNPDGEGIVYEAENKTLGDFAQKALDNYNLSSDNKNNSELKSNFDRFISYVIEKLGEEEKFQLTDNVYLFYADDKRFKYKGDNWTAHSNGLNMNFSELKKIINSGKYSRSEINKNEALNALTRQHATYFTKAIESYNQFIKQNPITPVKEEPLKNFVLIIDEINRANLSSVLGELIYALEYRGEKVESMYEVGDSNELILPPNLYIIGTMNTADRSVGHIDYAIRRRFAFVNVLAKDLTEELGNKFDKDLYNKVTALFMTNLSPEFEKKDVQLGHSYFIDKSDDGGSMPVRLEYEIKPILLEYVKDGILIGQDIKDEIEKLS